MSRVLLIIAMVGLFTSTVQAQGQYRSYLPIFRQDPPPATFGLKVMRVSTGRSGICVSPLVPAAAMQGDICPLSGDYISLVADNPDSIALGGRQGDSSDAAWAGEPGELIEPVQVIADADIVEIGVSGYVENAGIFTAPDDNYTVIALPYTEGTVGSAQTEPPLQDMADFQQTLGDMIDDGQIFDADWPGDVVFWDKFGLIPFRPEQCGVTHAVWVPEAGTGRLLFDRQPPWVMMGGHFEPAGLAACMNVNRWIRLGTLMSHPAAQNLQNRVNQRRGGAIQPFQWITDAQGTVYAFWSLASGTLAYYGYRVLNSTVPNPAMFLYIPNEFLDVTCTVVQDVKTCLIQEGEPGQ